MIHRALLNGMTVDELKDYVIASEQLRDAQDDFCDSLVRCLNAYETANSCILDMEQRHTEYLENLEDFRALKGRFEKKYINQWLVDKEEDK